MRYAAIAVLLLAVFVSARAGSKADTTRATVVYIAGDAVYLSVGRNAGVADSALCYIVDKKDTVVVLKVIATSSKSSVCGIVSAKRPVAVGDRVRISLPGEEMAAQSEAPAKDTPSLAADASGERKKTPAEPPIVTVHGRINAQYFAAQQSGPGANLARPGLAINLRGSARDIPLNFEFYGNFRSLSYGNNSPFGSGSINQSRIYTLALRYDDGTYRVAAGRLAQALIGSAGYVDGVTFSRRIDDVTLGFSGGFEPLFSQRSFGSDFRKASAFASYALPGSVPGSATVAYTRSYYHSFLDRDVASAHVSFMPTADWTFSLQSDVDLHRKEERNLVSKPALSNLHGSLHYRASSAVSLGVGVSSWRPSYAFSSVSAVPDSMLDYTLRTSPSADIALSLPSGISLFNTYSARSSEKGFGKEYSNYTSINVGNLLNQGLSARGSVSFNSTLYADMRGFGGALQRNFAGAFDATVRYQHYRYAYASWGGTTTSNSAAVDLMISSFAPVTFWGSVERFMSTDVNTTSITVDIGWRF